MINARTGDKLQDDGINISRSSVNSTPRVTVPRGIGNDASLREEPDNLDRES